MKIIKSLYRCFDGRCEPSSLGVLGVSGNSITLENGGGPLVPIDEKGPVAGWGVLDGTAEEIVRFADSEGLEEHLAQGRPVVQCWAIRRDELARIGWKDGSK